MTGHDLQDLEAAFGKVAVLDRGGAQFLRLARAGLPTGCKPETTEVLLMVKGTERPAIYVKPGIVGPHGGPPRSCTESLVEGEAWLQFSYQFPWDSADGLVKFVATALRRFAQHE